MKAACAFKMKSLQNFANMAWEPESYEETDAPDLEKVDEKLAAVFSGCFSESLGRDMWEGQGGILGSWRHAESFLDSRWTWRPLRKAQVGALHCRLHARCAEIFLMKRVAVVTGYMRTLAGRLSAQHIPQIKAVIVCTKSANAKSLVLRIGCTMGHIRP